MSNSPPNFFKLRQQSEKPLILTNIWDAASAKIVESQGAEAIATSSASLAWSLGYADGNSLPLDEHVLCIHRIRRASKLPLTVDIESGYSGRPERVVEFVERLVDVGVQGINIEDGTDHPKQLENKIQAINSTFGENLFINARTDTFLRALAPIDTLLAETQSRMYRYESSGADGIFIPGLTNVADIRHLKTSLPLNVMVENSTQIETLNEVGVQRFSFGPTPFLSAYRTLRGTPENTSKGAQQEPLDYQVLNDFFK